MDQLKDGVAVVTGGGSGIGRAIVLDLAEAAMNVVVADIEADAARAVAGEAAQLGVESLAVTVDVADHDAVSRLADTVFDRFGAVNLLCNNAGVLVFRGFADSIIEDWQWVYGVNVMGVIHGVHCFLPRMLGQDDASHIVNTSSIVALEPTGVYGASKAAILALTEALADELADTDVGVSTLLPGVVGTRIVSAERNRPDAMGRRTDEPAAAFEGSFGVDPTIVGRRLREGVLAGDRYIWAGVPADFGDLDHGPRRRLEAILGAVPDGIVSDELPPGAADFDPSDP